MTRNILAALFLSACIMANAQVNRHAYRNPTGKEFPILAWYSVLGDGNITPERYKELRNAGFNISFSHFYDIEDMAKGLEAAQGTGVKLMVMCDELEKNTAKTVNRFKNDPKVAGWFLRDEPTSHEFGRLREFRDRVYSADTTHTVYLNLFPSYGDPAVRNDFLGAESYEDYADKFVKEVGLPQISYDFYPVIEDVKENYVRPYFYENLEVIRRVARRHGMPFWAFVMSTEHGPYPLPSGAHLRYEAFSALAYGAQCIQYFTYWTPIDPHFNYRNAPISKDGRRTHVYYLAKELNREIQNLAFVFLGAEAVDVWHTGSYIPKGTTPLQTPPAPFTDIKVDGEGIVVSHLVNSGSHYLMIVNRDINRAQNVTIENSKAVKRIMPDGSQKREKSGRHTLPLVPGGYLLYKFA